MKLVSVIIPTYKRADKVEKAIESVLNQTYKNIEIIVVDDNANDIEQRKMTREVIKKHDGILLIENEKNLGGAETRNRGIMASNGEYVAFLDDDDIFQTDKIEKQVSLIQEKEKEHRKVGMIYCYKNRFDDNGMFEQCRKLDIEGNCFFEHMMDKMETTSTWLCPRSVLIDVGMFENVKAHQDNILLMKILAKGYEIYRVPEFLLDFYIHYGSGITKIDKDYIDKTKVLFDYKKKYYYLLTSQQIEQVEYKNSCMLIRLYRLNNMKKEYLKELKKVLKYNRFRKYTIKMMLFYFTFKRNKN